MYNELEDEQPWHPALGICPNRDLCSDPLPPLADQPVELRRSIDRYSSVLREKGKIEQKKHKTTADWDSLRLLDCQATRLELVICSKIINTLDLGGVREVAEKMGWPMTIDFMALAKFTWSLEAALRDLFVNPSKRDSDIVWITFLERVKNSFGPGDLELDKFAASTPVSLMRHGFVPMVYTG